MPYEARGFRVLGLFHTTSFVDNLVEMRKFHKDVFGVDSITIPYENGRYANMTFIGDTCLDTMAIEKDFDSPFRRTRLHNGEHWAFPSLHIEDTQDLIYQMRALRGFTMTTWNPRRGPVYSSTDAILEWGESGADSMRLTFTHPRDTGIEWEIYEVDPDFARVAHAEFELRWQDDWVPVPPPANTVGALRHAYHTIVLDDLAPSLAFLVDLCGGTVFHEGENAALGTASTFVSVGTRWPSSIELAVPTRDGPARADRARAGNVYHCLTFQVADLDHAVSHLRACGLGFETRTDDLVVIDPGDIHGLRYGFTQSIVPGDPRANVL